MFEKSAAYYDLIYGSFKDYPAEAVIVAEWIERYRPGAQTVLDVACGTGEHARLLATRGFHVDGIDLNPEFIRIARDKVSSGTFVEADMTSFALGRRYDAVICLFSAVGYARTPDRLRSTIATLADHLDDRGVMLVEPWFTPDEWRVGQVHHKAAAAGGVTVSRMGYANREGSISSIRFEYLVGREGHGIERLTEFHELGLFTRDEMTDAFEAAGLDVVHDATGISGRGLYVGRHRRVC